MPKSSTLSSGAPPEGRRDEEVVRLDVTMNDAGRVGFGKRLAGLQDAIDRALDRQRPSRDQHPAQIRAGQVLHHHVRRTVGQRLDVIHVNDVLGADFGCEPRLSEKPLGYAARGQRLGPQVFDGHALIEIDLRRRDDDPETALANQALDNVLLADSGAWKKSRVALSLARRLVLLG